MTVFEDPRAPGYSELRYRPDVDGLRAVAVLAGTFDGDVLQHGSLRNGGTGKLARFCTGRARAGPHGSCHALTCPNPIGNKNRTLIRRTVSVVYRRAAFSQEANGGLARFGISGSACVIDRNV